MSYLSIGTTNCVAKTYLKIRSMLTNSLLSIVLSLFSFCLSAHAACNPNILLSTPSSEFTDNADGTVTDNKTQLMWAKCTSGLDVLDCTGTSTGFLWKDALNDADVSTLATYTNWRLPNMKELGSIVETACSSPSINEAVFPGTISISYATSSPYVNSSANSSWSIDFATGVFKPLFNTNPNLRVRLVRDVSN